MIAAEDRHFGVVVAASARMFVESNCYMLIAPLPDDQFGNPRWTFLKLREGVFPVKETWLTFGPGHAWTEVEE